MLFVRESIQVKSPPQCPDLELLTLSLYKGNNRICLEFFNTHPVLQLLYSVRFLLILITFVSPNFQILFFLGYLNVNIRDPTHPCYRSSNDIMSVYSLSQVVDDFTHIHHSGVASIIDLVFMSSPFPLIQCCTIPPLPNSDHNGILVVSKWKATEGPTHRRRKIWRYAHANWDRACEIIADCNWDSLLSDDLNTSWLKWQQEFMSIMEQCMPQRSLPHSKNPTWMNKNLKQAMRRRSAFYKYGKSTGDYSKFKSARNRFVAQLCRSKKNYFCPELTFVIRINFGKSSKVLRNHLTQFQLYPITVSVLVMISRKIIC